MPTSSPPSISPSTSIQSGLSPSQKPTIRPTMYPSIAPTRTPTRSPIPRPTGHPTRISNSFPTSFPSVQSPKPASSPGTWYPTINYPYAKVTTSYGTSCADDDENIILQDSCQLLNMQYSYQPLPVIITCNGDDTYAATWTLQIYSGSTNCQGSVIQSLSGSGLDCVNYNGYQSIQVNCYVNNNIPNFYPIKFTSYSSGCKTAKTSNSVYNDQCSLVTLYSSSGSYSTATVVVQCNAPVSSASWSVSLYGSNTYQLQQCEHYYNNYGTYTGSGSSCISTSTALGTFAWAIDCGAYESITTSPTTLPSIVSPSVMPSSLRSPTAFPSTNFNNSSPYRPSTIAPTSITNTESQGTSNAQPLSTGEVLGITVGVLGFCILTIILLGISYLLYKQNRLLLRQTSLQQEIQMQQRVSEEGGLLGRDKTVFTINPSAPTNEVESLESGETSFMCNPVLGTQFQGKIEITTDHDIQEEA
jgi:hypothetical protein